MCIDYLFRSTTYLLATIILFINFISFRKKWDTYLLFSKFKWYFTNCYKLKMLSLNKTKTFI